MTQKLSVQTKQTIGLGIIVSLLWGGYPQVAMGQIAGDGTLGTLVNGAAIAPCTGRCIITNGSSKGSNLFHSFRQFSLPNGDVASFNMTPTIRNIFVRVTGVGSPFISNINGTIATRNPVNFFLLNPNGIIFGPNASLNIRGAFLATTASRMQFADGTEFRQDAASPLLTISSPIGLQLGSVVGNIQMQDTVLAADESDRFSDLALVGGDISLDNTTIQTPGRRVSLSSVGENGAVGLQLQDNQLNLSLSPDTVRQDIVLTQDSALNVLARSGGGGIELTGRNIRMNQSAVRSGILSGTGNAATNTMNQAGDITLNASDTIQLSDRSFITNNVRSQAIGNAGNLIITAANLIATNGSELQSLTRGQGNAGNILIDVRDRLLFERSVAASSVTFGGVGNGGNIRVFAGALDFTNTGRLTVSTSGKGNAGTITVAVRDRAVFDNSYLSGVVNQSGVGNGGDIRLATGTLLLTNGGQLVAGTNGQGNAGNIQVNVRDQIIADSYDPSGEFFSGVVSRVEATGIGKGGDIQVFTGSLLMDRGAQLRADVSGEGDAGNIQVTARNLIALNGGDVSTGDVTGLFTAVDSSKGKSGSILLAAPTIQLTNGAQVNALTVSNQKGGSITIRADELRAIAGGQVTTTTFSQGQAGDITVAVRDRLLLSGQNPQANQRFRLGLREGAGESGLFASTRSKSTGDGGSIFIDPQQLIVQDGATISVASQGSGKGGDIRIQAGQLILKNRGQITATTTSNQGGSILLNVNDVLLLRNASRISATAGTAQSGGNGGNITITMPQGLIVGIPTENSDITANAFTGMGGRVEITSQGIFGLQTRPRLTPFSDITASSESGPTGTVNIAPPDVDPNRGLVPLSTGVTDPSAQIDKQCNASSRVDSNSSQFVVRGRGGLPARPEDAHPVADIPRLAQVPEPISRTIVGAPKTVAIARNHHRLAEARIIEAQVAIRLAPGQIRFTATKADSAVPNSPLPNPPLPNCRRPNVGNPNIP